MKHHMPASHDTHPNVTPLIDIVMCLIIFYMLVAKIGVAKGEVKGMTLPPSLIGITLKDLGNTVDIFIEKPADETASTSTQAGMPIVKTLDPSNGQMITVQLLDPNNPKNHMLQMFLKKLKGENPEFKVIIRADQEIAYKYIEPVLIECSAVKPKNINFACRKEAAITQMVPEGK